VSAPAEFGSLGKWNGDRMARACSVCRHAKRHDIEADLRGGASYRDVAQQHSLSKDAVARHRAHMPRHTETGLAAAKEIITLLDKAEASASWNATVLLVREARQYLQELLVQTQTVPSSRAAE